jgi:hypothetical protein
MHDHPYRGLPAYSFWRKSIADCPQQNVDPVVRVPFTVAKEHRVATAGSCFAQHISRYLRDYKFNYLVTEDAHPVVTEVAEDFNYGTFTARYGNIYTSRQLLQLIHRIYGEFQPSEDIWQMQDGSYVDPFRPQIQPGGFSTREEYYADRAQHFARVRQALEELDVLVFTLGLTESWSSKSDGAVFPICPGVVGGNYDPDHHHFVNLSVDDVTKDLVEVVDRVRERNLRAKFILTVSPVPLIATAEDRHVLVSTTYSKSVLRVAAEQASRSREDVAYFPSYEIVTGLHTRGRYFAPDLRSVTEEGVRQVMRLFLKHYAETDIERFGGTRRPIATVADIHTAELAELVEVNCDEEALDRYVNVRRIQ